MYRSSRTSSHWYRLVRGDNVVESLTIAGVQRLLGEAGYDMGDLQDVAA